MFTVEVISVGNELLNGRTANTNLQWIGGRVYALGGWIRRAVTVPDLLEEIEMAVRESLSRRPDLVVTTGGLGPTYDDRTLEGVARALNRKLILNEEALLMIRRRLQELYEAGYIESPEVDEVRRKMAYLPEGAKPLFNRVGTAPGALMFHDGVSIACLPGVPAEMKDMFDRYVAVLISKEEVPVFEVVYEVRGVPEARMAPMLRELAKRYQGFYIKSHPKGFEGESLVEVQVKGRGAELLEKLDQLTRELEDALKELGAKFKRK